MLLLLPAAAAVGEPQLPAHALNGVGGPMLKPRGLRLLPA